MDGEPELEPVQELLPQELSVRLGEAEEEADLTTLLV